MQEKNRFFEFLCGLCVSVASVLIALRSALTKAQRIEMKSGATEDFFEVESLGWRAGGCQKS